MRVAKLKLAKEDYEREKGRWQQKLEEAELKLNEASINNSELFQIKAELVSLEGETSPLTLLEMP